MKWILLTFVSALISLVFMAVTDPCSPIVSLVAVVAVYLTVWDALSYFVKSEPRLKERQ